jgi:tetratricopeptide (TPR) repeat protein
MSRFPWLLIVTSLMIGGLAGGVSGQVGPTSGREAQVIREASGLEWRGRIQEAETLLEEFMMGSPTSSAGLFALERVLRTQGRVGEVLPWTDRYLSEDPTSSAVRYMKMRVLVEVDSLEALPPVAEAWFEAEPGSPDPYREVARLYQRAMGPEAALEVLERGQEAVPSGGSLALAKGDVHAEMGDDTAATVAWARALEDPAAEVEPVVRRLRGLEGDPEVLARPLLDALADGSTPERREAAVEVAIRFGLDDEAISEGRDALAELPSGERRAFLRRVADGATEAERPVVAVWALEEARRSVSARERLGIDLQLASAALMAGDTARALEAQAEVARRLPDGSVERRQVMAELIRVQAPSAPPRQLEELLAGFESEYPEAQEADELRALVAAGLAGRGEVEAAQRVAGAGGGSLTALEEGYLRLQAGDVAAGTEALQQALPELAPTRATEVLHLLASLGRVGPNATVPLAQAAARGHQGRPSEGSDRLVEALPGAAEEDRPTLMSWAGELARQAGESDRAVGLLSTVVEEYPDAPEFPEAALALADLHDRAGRSEEAGRVLERLILERPESPVAPTARRALQRIRRGTAGSEAVVDPTTL